MKLTVLALAASLVLAGCFGSPKTESSESDPDAAPKTESSETESPKTESSETEPGVEPATGQTITGNGYSFVAPEGWLPIEDRPEGLDTMVANPIAILGFSNNMNVLQSQAGQLTPEQIEPLAVEELENFGAIDVRVRDRVAVAGSESAHLAARSSAALDGYQVEQFYVIAEGHSYVVTFSFHPTVSEADRDALSNSVLATWSWT